MFLTKNLHPKKSQYGWRLGGGRAYRSDFRREKYGRPVYRKILKKEAFHQFTTMKKFSKFWFQQDVAKVHTADLTLDLFETHFKKCVISNRFPLKKKGTGAGRSTAPISFLWTISTGLCKGPLLHKQTDNDFGSAKKYHRYFRFASRGSGHFLVSYPELPEAFRASCGEGGWTHRKCYNFSCLTSVLPLNFVHSTIFKNFFRRERLFWKIP